MDTNRALAFAERVAKQAGALMRQNFAFGMQREWKEDATPLTKTDLAVNQLVMDAVEREYPDVSFIGEEGSRMKEGRYTWVCDPIDGTVPFSHGYPTFAFSLALTDNGVPIVGVIYDPVMDRLLSAEKGKGARLNGERISVSSEETISERSFVSANLSKAKMEPLRTFLIDRKVWMLSLYSCVYSSMLVAVGEITAEVYSFDKPWDAAAVKIVVEEAGGRVTSLTGEEQRYDGTINGFIASNGKVHDEILRALNGSV